MLKYILLCVSPFLTFLLFYSCSNDDSSASLSESEKKLIGRWGLKKAVYQEPGQPESVAYPSPGNFCYMDFKNDPSPINNQSSPIFSNTKLVDDHKDCTWLWNAWKVSSDGKLLLASIDTVYADIEKITNDSLVLKMTFDNYYLQNNTHHVLNAKYYLTR